MTLSTPAGLVRGIRRWDLVALAINFIVGAGIFGLPSRVYRLSGPASLIALAICAAALFLVVLCFAEVGSRYVETGGPYLYARDAFGPLVGFEVGWLRWLSGVTSFAANSNLLVDYSSYLWPTVNAEPWRALVITALSVSLTIINLLGVRDAAAASNLFAVGKMAPLVLFIAVGVFFVDPQRLLITRGASYGALSLSVLLLVHTFTGFESVGIAAGEVRDPQRSVPFALFTAIGAITLMYLLIQAVCIGTLPELASSTRPLADAGTLFLGSAGGYLIALGAIISIAGNLSGQLLVTPRTIFAMAEQRQLPQAFASVHPRFRTPYVSISSSAAVILGFALSGTFIQLVTISVLSRVAVYAITCLALPVLRRKSNLREPSFKVPSGNLIAIAAFLMCLWMLSSSTKGEALMTTIAAAVGLLLYLAHKMRTARSSRELRT